MPRPSPTGRPGGRACRGPRPRGHLGRAAACGLLLDHGADPGRGPLYGLTPLHLAASTGHLDVVDLLVRHGAPLDVRDGLHEATPLGWALHNQHRDERLLRLLGGDGAERTG